MNLNDDIKVFFIDLDGTTLDTKKGIKHWVSDENLRAINEKKQEHKKVIISTGRMGKAVEDYVKLIRPSYTVASNGAVIYDRDMNILREQKLSIQQVLKIFAIIQKHKLMFKLDGNSIAYGVKKAFWRKAIKQWGFSANSTYNFPMHETRYKFVMWGKFSKSKIQKIMEEIRENVADVSVVSSGGGFNIEVTHKDATKGIGNKWVLDELEYKKEQAIHIGDTMNDSTTVDYVERLVVMANGSKKLKEVSNWRGPNYKNGGLAKVLRGEYQEVTK